MELLEHLIYGAVVLVVAVIVLNWVFEGKNGVGRF
jgi:hypothetical protein